MTGRPMPRGLERPPAGAGGYHDRSTPHQRREIREMCGLLRDSLFDREGSNDEGSSAVWVGPIGWAVEYGIMRDGEHVWARIYLGDTLYRDHETLDATVEWLHGALP